MKKVVLVFATMLFVGDAWAQVPTIINIKKLTDSTIAIKSECPSVVHKQKKRRPLPPKKGAGQKQDTVFVEVVEIDSSAIERERVVFDGYSRRIANDDREKDSLWRVNDSLTQLMIAWDKNGRKDPMPPLPPNGVYQSSYGTVTLLVSPGVIIRDVAYEQDYSKDQLLQWTGTGAVSSIGAGGSKSFYAPAPTQSLCQKQSGGRNCGQPPQSHNHSGYTGGHDYAHHNNYGHGGGHTGGGINPGSAAGGTGHGNTGGGASGGVGHGATGGASGGGAGHGASGNTSSQFAGYASTSRGAQQAAAARSSGGRNGSAQQRSSGGNRSFGGGRSSGGGGRNFGGGGRSGGGRGGRR